MTLFRILIKFVTFPYFLLKTGNIKAAMLFAHYNLPITHIRLFKISEGMLVLNSTGNKIPVGQLSRFKHNFGHLFRVLNDNRFSVSDTLPDSFVLNAGNVSYRISSQNNLNIVHELYLEKLYNLHTVQKDIVVMDIGMNVGFASLFFASDPNVAHVYGYEPFAETYAEAVQNLGINPSLKDKISPVNVGISNRSGSVNVPQLEGGSVIASTNSSFIEEHKLNSGAFTTVHVKGITEALDQIVSAHPGKAIYIKIDCEGEEYNILDSLDQQGIPEQVAGMIVEWHFKGSAPLVELLSRHHFTVFDTSIHDETIYGMLYAFKIP